ncbi:hypothetical protein K2X92_01645, partial [Candidatus Gracilibacteria bacterium]|nr:hypothetical protein [Candidatus Gracilibacteria bacterium]
TSTDSNFSDSIIINTQEGENNISYALRYSSTGELEGNMFEYSLDGTIKYTQQLHGFDMISLGAHGVISVFQDAFKEKNNGNIESLKTDILRNLYLRTESFDPFVGSYPNSKVLDPIKSALQKLNTEEQIALADWFFEITIGHHISNNRNAYKVYYVFKGTSFSTRFHELETTRLKNAGYPNGFIL